jgi:peptide/histidine transporter 3/4
MNVLGTAIVALPVDIVFCSLNVYEQVAILSPPILTLFGFPFVLAFSCWKRRWFIANPAQHNPYKMVIKVLNFVRHKWPLRRSAFTYCDDEKPSRVDYAKERYGGPLTTEHVEDVKAFLKILGLLSTLGPWIFHPRSWVFLALVHTLAF